MNPISRSLAIATVSGGAIAAMFAGPTLVRYGNVARAEDAPAQGKVQAPVQASPQEQQQLESLASIFRKVGKSVEPAVVQIDVIKTTKAARPPGYDEWLRQFFKDRNNDGEPDLPEGMNDGAEEFKQQGTGSGVIMEVNGSEAFILTNNHVAGGATQMTVTLSNGTEVEGGTLVGADPKTDLAIVKIKAEGLVAAPWGNSDELEKGDWILAFGSPFNYVGSMTHGIVSAINRRAGILGPNGYENFIQVDAPINPGNSGGPLVNTRGQVVGINTAIASRTGGFQGIGFAIPSNQAKTVYTALKQSGKVVRGYIGVGIADAASEPETRKMLGYTSRDGVLVKQTYGNTPATGKLQPGDIITALGGKPVKDAQELRNTIAATAPGTDLKVSVFRRNKTEEVTIKIGEQPEDMTLAMVGGRPGEPAIRSEVDSGSVLGMKLATPNENLVKEYSLGEIRKGALVTEVDPRSPAARAQLQKGDVITRVIDQDVANAKEAAEAIRKADQTKDIHLYVSNAQASRLVVIKPTGT
jgi:serine protease Do